MAITYRAVVGRELTNAEIDANFSQLANGSAVGFKQSGTDVERPWLEKARDLVFAEDFGAVGDGVTDDTAALNAALALGLRLWLRRNATYRVTSSLIYADNSGIFGDGTPTIYAPAASFDNASLDSADRYGTNAVVINMSGQKIAPYTPRDNVVLRGVRIESEVSDGRVVTAVVAQNVTNLEITDNEIFGFPVGCGIRASSILGNSKISNNHIHDFADDTDWGVGTVPQLTGIEIDNDQVNSIASDGFEICNNRIQDLTVGATFLAAHGYQTDGINIAKETSVNYTASNNRISGCGEGIDTFGGYGAICGNVIVDSYIFGIKLIHGADTNAVQGNVILRSGLAGINISGSNSATKATQYNNISGNTIRDIDPDGAWSASTTGCIRTASPGLTRKQSNNLWVGNILHPGANGKWCIVLDSDGENNSYKENRMLAAGTSGWVSTSGGTETFTMTDARPTSVRVSRVTGGAQSIPDATATKIQFDTVGTDRRDEYDEATNFRWICQIPGRYRAYAQARFGTMSDGILIAMEIRKSGASLAFFATRGGAANDMCVSAHDVVECGVGDYIEAFVTQNSGGGTARDITALATRTFMTIEPA